MEVVVTTGAISRAKLQSNHHHQQTNIQFFLQTGCPSCRPTNSVKALKGKYHTPWTCLPQAHLGVFQLCLWPLIAPGYLGGGLPCLSSALWCQYPSRYALCCVLIIFPVNIDLRRRSTNINIHIIGLRLTKVTCYGLFSMFLRERKELGKRQGLTQQTSNFPDGCQVFINVYLIFTFYL